MVSLSLLLVHRGAWGFQDNVFFELQDALRHISHICHGDASASAQIGIGVSEMPSRRKQLVGKLL